MAAIVSVDIETTGLDPRRHELWEVGMVEADGTEHHVFRPIKLRTAEPDALQIGRYYERQQSFRGDRFLHDHRMAEEIAVLTANKTFMGVNPAFDARFLDDFLREQGYVPAWKHRLLDLGAYAAGVLGREEPLSSHALAEEILPNEDVHTAIGDARWNWQVYRWLRTTQKVVREFDGD